LLARILTILTEMCGLPQFPQMNAGIIPWPLPSTSIQFIIPHRPIIQSSIVQVTDSWSTINKLRN
jgi:hypothetical protein